jgi:hypothetical protein
MRASGKDIQITTAALERRSPLIGAIVQAINVAIHNAVDRNNQSVKNRALQLKRHRTSISSGMEVVTSKEY